MAVYFISDLHLDDHRPDLLSAFDGFLSKIEDDAQALYILGDFFEAWIGDDDDAPWIAPLCDRLAAFAQDVDCYFCHGNRDFLVGEALAKRCGFTLLDDETEIEIYQQRYLIAHGDSYCTDDVQYQGFRQLVRNPQWQAEMLAKPLEERRLMAQALRNNSKDAQREKADDIMDVNQSVIKNTLENHKLSVLIHGHTHRPNIHQFELDNHVSATRIVLGDWDSHRWWLRIDEQGYSLNKEKIAP